MACEPRRGEPDPLSAERTDATLAGPMWTRLFLGASASLLCACGSRAAPSARLRLWDQPAELVSAAAPATARAVFTADFEQGLEGWAPVAWPARGPAELRARVEHEAERAFLRLEGVHGGLHLQIPIEPDTCYVLSGELRANGIESDSAPFHGASLWLGEASAAVPLAELLVPNGEFLTRSHTTRSVAGLAGWQAQRIVFVSTSRTRSLDLVCSLAGQESVRAGSVDFARLTLEARPLAALWHEALEHETRERLDVDPPEFAWQRARRVSAQLGGEHRPSIVLVPGDRLRFELPRLQPGARFACGAGAWRPSMLEGLDGTAELRVRADGRELLARAFEARGPAQAGAFAPLELALGEDARVLELELAGDAALVLGAPLVRTAQARPEGPNVLLVSLDTLRADHVGAYGYPGGTTPNLDRLAARGLVCRDTSSQAPYTLPAHATLLSGQFPSTHGVVTRGRTLTARRSSSLAEILGAAGFATQAFTAGGFVNADFGLDRGFEGFAQIDPIREAGSHYQRNLARRAGPALAERLLDQHGFAGVERWLAAHAHERFFLFLHTYTVHDYDTPERYLRCDELGCARPSLPALRTRTAAEAAAFTPAMRAHVGHLYDAALRYTDERLGALFTRMAELGVLADTLIVVTSDHGEEFFEHGALQHGRTLYEELLGVPLILAGPGIEPGECARPAMLVDVAPTLLARLGFARDPRMQGVDLLGPDWPTRAIWSEVDDHAFKYALREESGRKTIHGPTASGRLFPNEREWELYELARDPGEAHDLAGGAPADLGARRDALLRQRRALEEYGASLGTLGQGGVDESTLSELEELGYGGGDDE